MKSPKHLRQKAWEETKGSDGIKSGDPFLQAAASAEETLEDTDTKIWAYNSGMEDVWRCSQHPPFFFQPLPLRHTPQHWLSCLCRLLLLSRELRTVYSASLPFQKKKKKKEKRRKPAFPPAAARLLRKSQIKKRRKGRFSRDISRSKSREHATHVTC